MGEAVTGCSALTAGTAEAGNRPGAGPATADSVCDEVADMVIPPTTSTRAALPTKAITAPCVPTTSPAARPTHRRAPKAYPDCGAGAAGSSPPWLSPLIGVIGVASRSVTAAAGGCELVTGWKRSPACRVRGRVEGLELTKTRSPWLESVQRA